MDRVLYRISGGLSHGEIQKIRDDAFDLLSSVGVAIEDADVLDELARRSGVRVEGELVFYSPELVGKFIAQVCEQNAEYMLNVPGREEPLVRPPFLCLRVWDLDDNEARPATTKDLARAVKLLDSYGAEGVPPVDPQDAPLALRNLIVAKTSYENSRGIGGYLAAASVREAELLSQMGEAAGRPGPHVALQIPHSPMRLDAHALRLVLEMKRAGRTPRGVAVGGGAMPLAGAAAPLLMPGFLAQGLAEALAAYGTGKLLNQDVLGYCSVFPGTFDMRHAGLAMASPEAILYWLAVRQVFEAVFGQTIGGDFASMGKTYDAQGGAEKTAATLTAVLSGATTFSNAGMTPMDEVFHFEGVALDMEILGYAWRAGRGLAWEETPSAEIVRAGRVDGTFLTHPTTMRFREELWAPEVFTRETLNQWIAEGSPTVNARAMQIAGKRIDAHDYRPSPSVQRELNRIMEMAQKDLW